MARRSPKVPWSQTQEGVTAYEIARANAQRLANESGFDIGLEANDLFREWRTMALPRRENRRGFELQCEVVSCESLDRCQPGHGPRS